MRMTDGRSIRIKVVEAYKKFPLWGRIALSILVVSVIASSRTPKISAAQSIDSEQKSEWYQYFSELRGEGGDRLLKKLVEDGTIARIDVNEKRGSAVIYVNPDTWRKMSLVEKESFTRSVGICVTRTTGVGAGWYHADAPLEEITTDEIRDARTGNRLARINGRGHFEVYP